LVVVPDVMVVLPEVAVVLDILPPEAA